MYDYLKNRYAWTQITGCPGRYTLAEGVVSASIRELVGADVDVSEGVFENATDPVLYCYFEGGGLITYRKPTGYLHTLCNEAGLDRKMKMLKKES